MEMWKPSASYIGLQSRDDVIQLLEQILFINLYRFHSLWVDTLASLSSD